MGRRKVIVVGGGASGMMAAIAAAEKGAQVTLLEKNNQLGKKLLITGKGRCNVTNSKDMAQLINSFPHNGKFLFTAFTVWSNEQTMAFFEQMGVALKVERGDRVFPQSDQAKDIVWALNRRLKQLKVEVHLGQAVQALLTNEAGAAKGVVLADGRHLEADRVIVAVGGMSYPGTGSSGDGYSWAKAIGHTIKPLRPALVPLESPDEWLYALQGLSLKNVRLTFFKPNGKKLAEEFGEMLFTHFGISGPIVLTLSSQVVDQWQKEQEPLTAEIDLKPALSVEQLDQRLLREIDEQHNKQLKNVLTSLLPQKLIPVFIERVGIAEDRVMHQLTRGERQQLIHGLKHFAFRVHQARPLAEAIVTAGGIHVKEISPQTMESKLVSGLYFTGEILDIDGITGGFNLQAAFSTGYLAGASSAE
mgnify:CR=1 FL=1